MTDFSNSPDHLRAVQRFLETYADTEVHILPDGPGCYAAALKERDNDVYVGYGKTVSEAMSALERGVEHEIGVT